MSENPANILVIEDDPPIRRFLRASLGNLQYQVTEAAGGKEALLAATQQPPDLVDLDLGLPDMDGIEVIRRLRDWSAVPIIIVSARGRRRTRWRRWTPGADDYLTKPFGVGELHARIRVALRHAATLGAGRQSESTEFTVGDLRVDLAARRVFVAAEEIHLTPIEYKLLVTLVHHAGKVLTHRFLLKEVWGPPYVDQSHYLRIFMANLRRKIEADSARPRPIC